MTYLRFGLPVVAFLMSGFTLNAQTVRKKNSCSDALISQQADSIKQAYSSVGYIVVKEAFITMVTEFEIPVMVPLTQDNAYQFVFIGDTSSSAYELSMFDWDEKRVAYQRQQKTAAPNNIISYPYVPQFSEYHLVKPLQVNYQKQNMCGFVMLLKKVKT